MGNACDELKARGWSVTATNDECGLAHAVETFVLRSRAEGTRPMGRFGLDGNGKW
jgi:hypothetical protein